MSNGDRYEGDFNNNKKEGKGLMLWNYGNSPEGDWKNDKREGKGIMYYNVILNMKEIGKMIKEMEKGL